MIERDRESGPFFELRGKKTWSKQRKIPALSRNERCRATHPAISSAMFFHNYIIGSGIRQTIPDIFSKTKGGMLVDPTWGACGKPPAYP